jgi:protein-tyrosine phosphatase
LLWLLWLWPCISFALFGLAYILDDPRDVTRHRSFGAMLLGKELDGSMRWYCLLLMLPVLVSIWVFWYVRHSTKLRNERPYNEIVPGIYLGRFPLKTFWSRWKEEELFPVKSTIIVDLVAEMPVPRKVYKGRRYLCIPTLDQCPPNVEALREVGASLATHDERTLLQQGASNSNFRRLESQEDIDGEGVRIKGSIYVFCANGRGRSAVFIMVLLVMRGNCDTIEQALEVVRKSRPQVNPKPEQLQAAREAVAVWKDEQRNKLNLSQRSAVNADTGAAAAGVKGRKREHSNADLVEIPSEILLAGAEDDNLSSSRNIIKLDESTMGISSAKMQIGTSFSRKRGLEEDDDDNNLQFYIAGPPHPDFTLRITRKDISLMVRESFKHLSKETGGDLFGEFVEDGAKVFNTIGPGSQAKISGRAFIQDYEYTKEAKRLLTNKSPNIVQLGDW